MEYWAYENWRARGHVTKVHRHDCRFCKDGRGLVGGTRSDNGKWHHLGHFDSPDDALAAARYRVREGTVRPCGKCM